MSRPDKQASWCDDDLASKVVEPGNTKKLAGFLYKERMPFQYLNWLFRHFVKWFLHIDESVNQFDPHSSFPADEFINVTAGRVNSGTTVIEKALQQIDYTAFIPTTASTSRIDRIVIDNATGVISRIAGTEAGSPTAPSITSGKSPVCQVLIDEDTTVIESALITDERTSNGTQIIILDTPEEIAAALTHDAWTTVNSTTLGTANAKKAILRVILGINKAAVTELTGVVYIRKTGSALTVNDDTDALRQKHVVSAAVSLEVQGVSDITINLDSDSDFDYYYSTTAALGTDVTRIILIGYYL